MDTGRGSGDSSSNSSSGGRSHSSYGHFKRYLLDHEKVLFKCRTETKQPMHVGASGVHGDRSGRLPGAGFLAVLQGF